MRRLIAAATFALLAPSMAAASDYWWVGADAEQGMSFYLDTGSLTSDRDSVQGLIVQVFEGARRAGQGYAYNRDQIRFACDRHEMSILNQISFREDGQIDRSDAVNQTVLVADGTPGGKLWALACGRATDADRRGFVHVGAAEPATVDAFVVAGQEAPPAPR